MFQATQSYPAAKNEIHAAPNLGVEIDGIQKEIDAATEALSALASRLQPLLIPPPPTDGRVSPGPAPSASTSPTRAYLQSVRDSAVGLRMKINTLTGLLDV